jgi:putative ABC transport system ATP-binding protein
VTPVLRAAGLGHRYGATTVLRDVDMAVFPGETVAVTGPSGSGKSTLLHCLAGILAPAEGQVWFGEDRIDGWSEARRTALRGSRFGFVFQFAALLPELPAVENVAVPLMLAGIRRAEAVARATAWFLPLGLAGLEDRRPGQLSGGQEQRVAIARAIVTDPTLLLADEPTGDLDAKSGAEILTLLQRLNREFKKTIIMVTHDPHAAERATQVYHLEKGTFVAA